MEDCLAGFLPMVLVMEVPELGWSKVGYGE